MDRILASCYAVSAHELAHFAITPLRWFPRFTNWIFGQNNGMPGYVNIAEYLGRSHTCDPFWSQCLATTLFFRQGIWESPSSINLTSFSDFSHTCYSITSSISSIPVYPHDDALLPSDPLILIPDLLLVVTRKSLRNPLWRPQWVYSWRMPKLYTFSSGVRLLRILKCFQDPLRSSTNTEVQKAHQSRFHTHSANYFL